MSRQVQAWDEIGAAASPRRRLVHCLSLLAALGLLAGCGARGIGLDDIAVDRSLVTGSVESTASAPADQTSDQVTMRNAVGSINVEQMGGQPIYWANPETGSRGAITAVDEYSEKGVTCRRFTASRESFRGVALYRGDACLGDGGNWWMRSFDPS